MQFRQICGYLDILTAFGVSIYYLRSHFKSSPMKISYLVNLVPKKVPNSPNEKKNIPSLQIADVLKFSRNFLLNIFFSKVWNYFNFNLTK